MKTGEFAENSQRGIPNLVARLQSISEHIQISSLEPSRKEGLLGRSKTHSSMLFLVWVAKGPRLIILTEHWHNTPSPEDLGTITWTPGDKLKVKRGKWVPAEIILCYFTYFHEPYYVHELHYFYEPYYLYEPYYFHELYYLYEPPLPP